MNALFALKKEKVISTSYLSLCVLKTIVSAVYPFVNIIIPTMLIEELVTSRNVERLTYLVILIVGINFTYRVVISIIDARLEKQKQVIGIAHDFLISEISMGLPYELLETDKMIQTIKEVKEGQNRSGGVALLIDLFFQAISKVVTILSVVVLIASLNFWLIVLCVVTIIINTWVQAKLKNQDIEFFKVLMKHNQKFMYLSSVILNRKYAKDIRLYDANKTFTSKMDEFTEDVDTWFKNTGSKKTKYSILSHLTDSLSQIIIYGFLAFQFILGSSTIALFTMYISAINVFTNTIVDIMKLVLDIYEKYKWLKPTFDFMEYKQVVVNDLEGKEIVGSDTPMIEFRNVSFCYENSSKYAIKNLSLTIPYGEKLSVVGLNGAGKTTLVKLLLRLYKPTEGQIFFDGVDINDYSLLEYYKLFSVVFQDFKLVATTIKENIMSGLKEENERKLIESMEKSGVLDRVKRMKYQENTELYKLLDSEGIDLSGGEEQRIAISRALYKNAKVVVLDEPTSALDPKTEYEIYTSMDKLIENKTSIYISHRMTSCIFCDKVAVFDNGELVQYGAHKKLIEEEGIYANMFKTQAKYY